MTGEQLKSRQAYPEIYSIGASSAIYNIWIFNKLWKDFLQWISPVALFIYLFIFEATWFLIIHNALYQGTPYMYHVKDNLPFLLHLLTSVFQQVTLHAWLKLSAILNPCSTITYDSTVFSSYYLLHCLKYLWYEWMLFHIFDHHVSEVFYIFFYFVAFFFLNVDSIFYTVIEHITNYIVVQFFLFSFWFLSNNL